MSSPTRSEPSEPAPWSVFASKPARALVVCAAGWLILSQVPALGPQVPDAPATNPGVPPDPSSTGTTVSEASELTLDTKPRPELAQPAVVRPGKPAPGPIAARRVDDALPTIDDATAPVPLIDESGQLAHFYRALDRTKRREAGAVTRITFHGDSLIASDYITATLRRKFQAEFGDAGHGFVLMADPWPSYFHNDVFRFTTRGFQVRRVVGPYASDGMYGLGGVSFEAPPGVRARFGTVDEGDFGRSVSRFRLFYLKQPHGGKLLVNVDGVEKAIVDTEAAEKQSGVAEVQVPDGPHLFEVVTKSGMTRTFGAVLERDGPGVVVDAIGIQGARIRFVDKQDDQHWADQLRLRNPNLVVFLFGANESIDGIAYSLEDYHDTMKAVLVQAKRALPEASCLLIAPLDRARQEGSRMVSVPIMPELVRVQEATAREVGCAFWNTYAAMGGEGSMAKWVLKGMGQADMTHPSGLGALILGNWIYRALLAGFEAGSTDTP